MAEPQTQPQVEGLPAGVIIKPLKKPTAIEGLPQGAVVKSLTHGRPSSGFIPPDHQAQSKPGQFGKHPLIDRLLEATGIPKNPTEWHEVAQTVKESTHKPGGMAQTVIENYLSGLKGASKVSAENLVKAVQNIHEGKPIGPELYRAASGYGHTLAAALPVAGPIIEHIYQDAMGKDWGGVLGGALGLSTNVILLKIGQPYSAESKVNKLAFVTDASGNAVDYVEAYKNALPDLERTAKRVGKPATVGEFKEVVDTTRNELNNEFSLALQPIAGQQTIPQQIADEITAPIRNRPNLAKTPEGRKLIADLRRRAVDYQKPWTMRELDQERMDANARLRSFYNKREISGKTAALRIEADEIADRAIVNGARDIVYNQMDQVHNKPSGYFSNLKQRQSSLIAIDDRLSQRIKELHNASAARKGAPILSSEKVSTYGHPTGSIGFSIHRLQDLIRSPEMTADVTVKRAFKGTSNAKQSAISVVASLPVRVLIHEDEGFKTLNSLERLLRDQDKEKQK